MNGGCYGHVVVNTFYFNYRVLYLNAFEFATGEFNV